MRLLDLWHPCSLLCHRALWDLFDRLVLSGPFDQLDRFCLSSLLGPWRLYYQWRQCSSLCRHDLGRLLVLFLLLQ